MTESEQADSARLATEETDRQLKDLGFDPGIPVFEMTGDIEREQIQQALFASTYRSPVTVPFTYTEPTGESCDTWAMPMLVELVQAVYKSFGVCIGDAPLGNHEHPDLYLRGWLSKSAFDPYPETIRMHALLRIEPDEGGIEHGILQIVRHPSGADPQSRLTFGDWPFRGPVPAA
jgi:hypothetical protein